MVQVELERDNCLDVSAGRRRFGAIQRQQQQQQHQRSLQNSQDLANLLFDQCGDCNRMASLPQAAFAVHKLRKPHQNQKDLAVARRLNTDKQEAPRYLNNNSLDLTPVKYSDKLMNSIWGLYNRYSPHNFKKNNGSEQQYFSMPQPFAVACAASEKNNSGAKSDPWKL